MTLSSALGESRFAICVGETSTIVRTETRRFVVFDGAITESFNDLLGDTHPELDWEPLEENDTLFWLADNTIRGY